MSIDLFCSHINWMLTSYEKAQNQTPAADLMAVYTVQQLYQIIWQ